MLRLGINRFLWPAWPLVVLMLAVTFAACGGGGDSSPGQDSQAARPKVAVSLAIFADFVRQVGGDRVVVSTLVPGSADVHTFQPSPRDAEKIREADVVFINGWGLEAPLKDLVENNVRQDVPIIPLAGSGPEWAAPDTGPAWAANPHQWLDVGRAMSYVQRIGDALRALDQENADYYQSNAETYLAELRALNTEIEEQIAAIPPERRRLVTFHDSFSPLAHTYGLEMVGVVIASPGQEPSARDVADLVKAIQDQGVPAVFKEPQFNARVLELAAAEAGVQVCTLYSDSFSGEIDSYVELMRFDANELARCLG
jgi:manganese/iron transport system substrate-binding protein